MWILLTTKRNAPLISQNGYLYTRKNKSEIAQTWRCSTRSCTAKIRTPINLQERDEADSFDIMGAHSCRQKPDEIKRTINRHNIITKSINTDLSTREIINSVMTGANLSSLAVTGTQTSLEQLVCRRRKNMAGRDQIVERALNIGEDMMFTSRGSRFYQFGPSYLRNLEVSTDLVMFFSDQMISSLINTGVWSIDGTFSVCPTPWVQLYTISILLNHHVVPVVYVLLKSKRQTEYEKMLSVLKRLIPGLSPNVIVTDFELAAINAFQNAFPAAHLSGCLFHMGQNIQKKLILWESLNVTAKKWWSRIL